MKTYNVELKFQNEEDKAFWLNTLVEQRMLFNEMSSTVFKLPNRTSTKLVHDACYATAREAHPSLSSQMVTQTENEVRARYASSKSNKHTLKEPVEKRKLCFRLDRHTYSKFSKDSISLLSPKKFYRLEASLSLYPKIEEMFRLYEAESPLIFVRENKVFLAVPFSVPALKAPDESVLGVDLGMRRVYVTSEGEALSGKEYLKQKRKLRYLKRCLQSRGTKSAARHLKKVRKDEANFSKNYVHHVANAILETDKSVIVMEDLTGIKQSTATRKNGSKRTKHNNRMGQIPFYMLRQFLTYKAPGVGKRVETVNPRNTSRKDSRGLPDGIRMGCRYRGKDGVVLDADWNAAINIAQRYQKRPLSCPCPKDGQVHLRGRLLSTSRTWESGDPLAEISTAHKVLPSGRTS